MTTGMLLTMVMCFALTVSVAVSIEISGGLTADAKVVASGGAFLVEGDTVRVVDAAPATGK